MMELYAIIEFDYEQFIPMNYLHTVYINTPRVHYFVYEHFI